MIIFVDIDNTICKTNGGDYKNVTPYIERIIKINALYDKGNKIVYWTGRGVGSGKDFRKLTEEQLEKWGAKYHELRLDRPCYHLHIDDRSINSEKYFENGK